MVVSLLALPLLVWQRSLVDSVFWPEIGKIGIFKKAMFGLNKGNKALLLVLTCGFT